MFQASNLDDLDISQWIPFPGNKKRKSKDELFIKTRTYKDGKKLIISIGAEILAHLKVDLTKKDKVMLMQHPDDITYFMLLKSSGGHIVQANQGNTIKVCWNHPIITNYKRKNVPYSKHPNNTITFRLKNDGDI